MNDDAWHKRRSGQQPMQSLLSTMLFVHNPPFPPVTGKEANRQGDAGVLAAFTKTRSTIHGMVVEGNLAVVRWTWEGDPQPGATPSLGLAPTGKRVYQGGVQRLPL